MPASLLITNAQRMTWDPSNPQIRDYINPGLTVLFQDGKVYVQQHLKLYSKAVYELLGKGAYIYVCGYVTFTISNSLVLPCDCKSL